MAKVHAQAIVALVVRQLHELGHIVGLVLQPPVVRMRPRRQILRLAVAERAAVEGSLIDAQTADVQAGALDVLVRLRPQRLAEDGMARLSIVAGNPLSLPGLVELCRLKPCRVALGLFVRIGAHRHLPPVARPRGKGDVERTGLGVERSPARVDHHFVCARHYHPRCCGTRALRILDHPREGRTFSQVKAQGIGDVIDLQARDTHGFLL